MKSFKVLLALFFVFSMNTFSQTSELSLLKKINLEGNPKWDYLTVDGDRLFVSNDDRVHVINLKTDTEISSITNLKGVHGITLAAEFNKGFISNGKDSTVTVFDYTTLNVLNNIKVGGKKADAIYYDKFSKCVFVYCNGSDFAVVIDAKTDVILKKISVGEGAEFAASNNKGLIYNNNELLHQITVIDTKKLEVVNTFSLSPNEAPTGLAIDLKNNRLFSACSDSKTLVVLNAENGKIIQTLPIGSGCDGVTYDIEKQLIVSANGEGNATVIKQLSANEYKIIQTLKTSPKLRTITHDEKTHKIYMSGASFEGKTAVPNSFGVYVYGEK